MQLPVEPGQTVRSEKMRDAWRLSNMLLGIIAFALVLFLPSKRSVALPNCSTPNRIHTLDHLLSWIARCALPCPVETGGEQSKNPHRSQPRRAASSGHCSADRLS